MRSISFPPPSPLGAGARVSRTGRRRPSARRQGPGTAGAPPGRLRLLGAGRSEVSRLVNDLISASHSAPPCRARARPTQSSPASRRSPPTPKRPGSVPGCTPRPLDTSSVLRPLSNRYPTGLSLEGGRHLRFRLTAEPLSHGDNPLGQVAGAEPEPQPATPFISQSLRLNPIQTSLSIVDMDAVACRPRVRSSGAGWQRAPRPGRRSRGSGRERPGGARAWAEGPGPCHRREP